MVICTRVPVGVAARKEVRDRCRRSKTGEGEGSENRGSPETSMQLWSNRERGSDTNGELHKAPLSILSMRSTSSWLISSSKERELRKEEEEASSWTAAV